MATKKAGVKKAAKKKPPAKKTGHKLGKVKAITFFPGGDKGRVERSLGGPHDFTIKGGSHSLAIPKDQKIAKIKIAKKNNDINLAFDK